MKYKKFYEINNLDCKNKEHRKILLKYVMEILKIDEKPTVDDLKRYCANLKKKYNIKIKKYNNLDILEQWCFVMKTGDGYLITCFYYTEYEGYLKYIAHVYALVKSGKLKRVM